MSKTVKGIDEAYLREVSDFFVEGIRAAVNSAIGAESREEVSLASARNTLQVVLDGIDRYGVVFTMGAIEAFLETLDEEQKKSDEEETDEYETIEEW